MEQFNGLDVFKIHIDEDLDDISGFNFISLVEEPAMESNWRAFSEVIQTMKFNKDKQELVGALIIPDLKILRNDPELGNFYVMFDRETIEVLMHKFQANGFNRNLNLFHSDRTVEGVVTEMWLKEFDEDKSNALGFDLPIGTLFAKVKIHDEEFWNTFVKGDLVKGFSIELISGLIMGAADPYEKVYNEILQVIKKAAK